MFDDLKRFDDTLALQVLEKGNGSVTNVHLSFVAGIVDTKLLKFVDESYCRRELFVERNFLKAQHSVVFSSDVHKSVLPGHIEKSGVVGNELLFNFSHSQKRRRVGEKN